VRERETVRRAKEAGLPKPWSADPLLQGYRWCNVSRMDDRVSRELMDGWYCEAPPAVQLAAVVLARMVNWPQALLDATGGKPFCLADLPRVREALKARAAAGLKVFTGAYIVPGVPGESKVDSVCDLAGVIAHTAAEALQPTLRATWEQLIRWQGLGGFLAGQITADLAYLAAGRAWPDRFAWAPVGPGSARGINRLLGRPKDKAVTQAQFDGELAAYMALMRATIPEIDRDRSLGAQDYQSTLCEFDKYRRLELGEGTVRARYDGAGTTQLVLL